MKFGIDNPSWGIRPHPGELVEGLKAKAQWAENHGFVRFSGDGPTDPDPRRRRADQPFMEG